MPLKNLFLRNGLLLRAWGGVHYPVNHIGMEWQGLEGSVSMVCIHKYTIEPIWISESFFSVFFFSLETSNYHWHYPDLWPYHWPSQPHSGPRSLLSHTTPPPFLSIFPSFLCNRFLRSPPWRQWSWAVGVHLPLLERPPAFPVQTWHKFVSLQNILLDLVPCAFPQPASWLRWGIDFFV